MYLDAVKERSTLLTHRHLFLKVRIFYTIYAERKKAKDF